MNKGHIVFDQTLAQLQEKGRDLETVFTELTQI
jgi:ABC-type uncharacterized transport system ATPase subunit